ncbi:MAG TPA: PAC2 family protein, partial [Marmoricola sp.]|nr:PAC2 family protein [Marmoricola sp.]
HLTHHATDPNLILTENIWSGELRVPASAQSLLEIRLGEWGHPAMGFVAHVPHYLTQTEDKSAALRLVEALQIISGLTWDNGSLEQAAIQNRVEIDEQVAQSDELRQLVRGLEEQYDAFHSARTGEATNLLAQDRPLPTGEEIGSEFERFLAGLEDGED